MSKKILEMIENVDPGDGEALDEIDSWVFTTYFPEDAAYALDVGYGCPRYTRSRDALKAIRPKEWGFSISYLNACTAYKLNKTDGFDHALQTKWLPTEELAELHAIVQAIEWEQTQNDL